MFGLLLPDGDCRPGEVSQKLQGEGGGWKLSTALDNVIIPKWEEKGWTFFKLSVNNL